MTKKRSRQIFGNTKRISYNYLIITNKSILMKNLMFLMLASLFFASCGGSTDSANSASDSTMVADSCANKADSACVDTSRVGSAKK